MVTIVMNLFRSLNWLNDVHKLKIKVTTWHTCQTLVVHGPENQVRPNNGSPKMNVTQRIVHVTTKHFWKPMVNTGKHTKECRHTHYQVKVRYYKIGIVQVHINSGVT